MSQLASCIALKLNWSVQLQSDNYGSHGIATNLEEMANILKFYLTRVQIGLLCSVTRSDGSPRVVIFQQQYYQQDKFLLFRQCSQFQALAIYIGKSVDLKICNLPQTLLSTKILGQRSLATSTFFTVTHMQSEITIYACAQIWNKKITKRLSPVFKLCIRGYL